MQGDSWQQLQAWFEQARGMSAAERDAFVTRCARQDDALARQLQALLEEDTRSDDPVPGVLGRAAQQAVAGEREGWIGRQFGAWRIVQHLADGGMGAVFRAERADGQYRQTAAIKLLNPALLSAPARARLEAERQILARLSHPLIARLLDGGTLPDGMPYLVLEYIDGQRIDAWCRARALGLPERLRLFVRVCEAVDFAHRNLVVHRDIKPANILVDAQGMPHLMDFGIARLIDDDGSLTRSGERLLTPTHASPEQVAGGAITTATDVYALGVLLHELLTGSLPFTATNPAELARAIVEAEPTRPSRAVLDLPDATHGPRERERLARQLRGDLDTIVGMALRKEPARRYASAQDMAQDIERHLTHRPVQARRDTPLYRARKLLRRHPVAVPGSVLALALAVAGGVAFTTRVTAERDRALAAEQRAQRGSDFLATLLEGTGAGQSGANAQVSVTDLLKRAGERIDAELKDDPELADQMRSSLGQAYSSWGDQKQAKALLKPALERERARDDGSARAAARLAMLLTRMMYATFDDDDSETALTYANEAVAAWQRAGQMRELASARTNLGHSYSGLQRYAEAEPHFRAAIAIFRERFPDLPADLSEPVFGLAWSLHARTRLAEAEPLYEEALGLSRRAGHDPIGVNTVLNGFGGVQYDMGRFDRARTLWEEALASTTKLYGEQGHPAVARAWNMLGLLALEQGRYADALQAATQSLAMNLRFHPEAHPRTAMSLRQQGRALLGLGRLEEAEKLMGRALAAARASLTEHHTDLVYDYRALGRLAMARNDLATAERWLRDARAVTSKQKQLDRAPHDEVQWLLGRVIAERGEPARGMAEARQALQLMRERRPQGHYLRVAAEAGLGLWPFVPQPDAKALASGNDALATLQRTLGPDAFVTRELAQQIQRSGGG